MALNKGQIYERALFRDLKRSGKIPDYITRIDQISGQDITVFNRYGESGIEVKLSSSAAFGSGTLKFDHSKSKDPWILTESDEQEGEDTSKEIMRNVARKYKLTDLVNKEWYRDNDNYYPFYLEESNPSPARPILSKPRSKRGKEDSENLSEIKVRCSERDIVDYYASKGSHYIQIGKKGLYWFGKEDPLNISNKIPLFLPQETLIRVRVQPKGSGTYNFSYGLYIRNISGSNEDLEKNPYII